MSKSRDDRRGGSDRRKAVDTLTRAHVELGRAFAELASRMARLDPGAAFEAATEVLAGSGDPVPDRGVILAAAGLEACLDRLLAVRISPGAADAALSALASDTADPAFVDYTLKDLLGRALDREPVGRRGIKVSTWRAVVELLSARSALMRAGDRRLVDGFRGDAVAALQAARDWLEAAISVAGQLDAWSQK